MMLVLSRQRDESIMIGDDIEITIVDVRGEKVRLGISAPAHVPVHRKEVYEAIQREHQAAAAADGRPPQQVESLAKRRKKPGPPAEKPEPQPPPEPAEEPQTPPADSPL